MSHTIMQPKFKLFDKYDFVKSYVSISHSKDAKTKEEREEEAALIANAIKDTQNVLLENLATKDDIQSLKIDLKVLEHRMIIKLTTIMAALLTLLPVATDFIRHIFKF